MIPKVKKFEYLSAIKNHQDGEIVFVEDLNQEYYYLEEEDKWIPYFAEEEIVTVKEGETPGTNLYQLNKMLVANLTNYGVEDIKSAKKLIRNFIDENPANVYMLLCHDLRYYTIFLKNKNYEENMEDVVIECLEYFGDIKSIEYDEDSNVIELWFAYEEEPFVAYLFGYDEGVILCK
jgi:hypothetical protein